MKPNLIAPCGMNCGICSAYLRKEKPVVKCLGCREVIKNKYCRKCIIKNCNILKKNNWKFCSDKCGRYPCARLKSLDKRYRNKYGMSMVENLETIQKKGIRKFLKQQKKKYQKKQGVICVHNKKVYLT